MSYVNVILRSLFVFLLFASPAFAASVSVVPTGNPTTFSVQGTGMDGVAGIQLDITYDAASLHTPTVAQGGLVTGAMLAANTSRPGIIKIAIISARAFSGSGQIAVITFASRTGSGGIVSITSSVIDSSGAPLVSTATNQSSDATSGTTSTTGEPSQQASSSTQGSTATSPPSSGITSKPAYLGTVTLPGEQQQQRVDSQPAPSSTTPVYNGEPAATTIAEQTQPSGKPAADVKTEETPQYVVYKGILDRFRQYNGSKQLSAMVALFDKKVAQTIHQKPEVLLSDGQSKAELTVDIPARINYSPNFAVNGGTLVSFKQDKQIKGRWIVEVSPEAGTVKVTVTIIVGAEEFEFPLTVTPPVKTAIALDESGWGKFLKEVGTTKSPIHDLNNDGVRDYVDEFIFVANYLAGKSTPVKPAVPSNKSAQ